MAPEGAFYRAPRPLISWAGVLLCLTLVLFVIAVLAAIALGFWATAARGLGVPDFTGGLAILIPAVAGVIFQASQVLSQRHRERMDQQARGTAPGAPFVSPPSGGEVNPHGGPDTP